MPLIYVLLQPFTLVLRFRYHDNIIFSSLIFYFTIASVRNKRNGVPSLTLDEPLKRFLVRGSGINGAAFLTLCEPLTESSPVRTLQFTQPFYSRFEQGRKQFVFGERPEDLQAIETIDQRIWEKHETYLRRLEDFPLKKAAYYRELQDSTGIKSVRGLAEITGEDWSTIAKVLRTLELPQGIQDFLSKTPSPELVKHFHLRRLLELVRLGDPELQFAHFREMLDEINSNALEEKAGSSL